MSERDIVNEVRAMELLCRGLHDNIIAISSHGRLLPLHAFYFIDMELCDLNLQEFIESTKKNVHGLMDWDVTIETGSGLFAICAIIQQILMGVNFIHSHNEVHRDLNPQNSNNFLHGCVNLSFIFIHKPLLEDR